MASWARPGAAWLPSGSPSLEVWDLRVPESPDRGSRIPGIPEDPEKGSPAPGGGPRRG